MVLTSLERESRLFAAASSGSGALPVPVIRREGIRWTGGAGGKPLSVELAFENPSRLPTVETASRVEVAPFGAFLRWSPLAAITMPSLPPGGRRILTATLAGDQGLPRPPGLQGLGSALAAMGLSPPDLVMGSVKPGAHFAGNLNVHVNRSKPVERHVQGAVGLRPGRQNMAIFCVGDGTPDSYTFSIGSVEPGWQVGIHGVAWGAPLYMRYGTLRLSVTPPARAESGGLSIRVDRESTRQEALVEFELDVAARSKCFFF